MKLLVSIRAQKPLALLNQRIVFEMKPPRHFSRQRPPWWPENEEWPPKRWRHMPGKPFFRRMGCLFFGVFFFAFVGFVTFLGFIFNSFFGIHFGPPLFQRPDLLFLFGVAGFFILFSSVFWGIRSLRRMSMPLDELLSASNRVAEGDYSTRVNVRGTPEVRSLMGAFNSMTEKLEVNDKQRRNMLADLSHELRSPITIMQGNLEGMMDGVYAADVERLKSLYEETQLLARLVDDLRTLALAESGSLQLKREPTDLGLLIREVSSGFEAQAKEKDIRIELSPANVDEIELDPQRIREVLANLLANALRYTPSHGEVKVGVVESTTGLERSVTVFVQDSGAGIPSADLSRIFDRFYKSSDSGGMGLGLSIAKYLVEAHGGRIWAESDIVPEEETGRGTKISFALPR
jgi:two-component system OmpR family sensor kinase